MPLAPQTVSFTSPGFDYTADLAAVERKRKIADALQAQALTPIQQQTAGGFVVPTSPIEGLSKIAQALVSNRRAERADEAQRAVSQKAQDDLNRVLSGASESYTGRPAGLYEDASGNVGNAPAVAADPMKAATTYMSHPMTAQLGIQLMGQEASRARLAQALKGPQAATATAGEPPAAGPSAAPGASSTAPSQAASGPVLGGPAGGQPMEAWLATDPSGKAYLEQLAKDATEANKPIVNRGYGIGVMRNGRYVPDEASLRQALEMERGKTSITSPLEPPVTLKTSGPSGQEIQLSRPEYAEYQKTGQLPARYGQQVPPAQSAPDVQPGVPPGVPPEHAAAYQTVLDASRKGVTASAKAPSLGTVGLTQTQEEQIRQSGQQAANTEAGKEFISEMRQNYAKLRDVPATLENIERAKTLAAGEAARFMGPFGESKLAITKFLRSNLPGMGNLKTESVTSAEELQSTLFNQVMDNLKKMDASPSQYQQQVMQEAFGTLRTDPQSVPKILDVFSDILRNRVSLHNDTVGSAEQRGTTFPYDVKVKLPKSGQTFNLSPETAEFMKRNGLKLPGE